MRAALARPIFLIWAAAIVLVAVAHSPDPALAGGPLRYAAAGKPLEQVMVDLGGLTGVRYSASQDLARQRVTLFLNGVAPEDLQEWLPALLSAGPEASVVWKGDGSRGKTLTATAKWRELGEKLRSDEVSDYTQFLTSEVAWLSGEGAADLREFLKGRNPDIPEQRVRLALMLRSLGEVGRKRLLAGEPIVFQLAEVADDTSVALERVIPRSDIGRNAPIPKRFDRRCCVWRLSRSPGRAGGFSVEESVLAGDGGGGRSHVLTLPGVRQSRSIIGRVRSLRFRPADPNDPSRRVTVNLTPQPAGVKKLVRLTLDQLLERVAGDAGLNVVSDGYLRHQTQFEPNLILREYPLKQLLNSLGMVWDFDWRFAEGDVRTVLVRARAWYLEDEIDVSEGVLDSVRAKIKHPETVDLEYLSNLVEMPAAQLHKLVVSGSLPSSLAVVGSGYFDEPVLPALIRFVTDLEGPERRTAGEPGGLSLSQAPQALVRKYLSEPLLLLLGRDTPDVLAKVAVEYKVTAPGSHRFAFTLQGLPLVDKTLSARPASDGVSGSAVGITASGRSCRFPGGA